MNATTHKVVGPIIWQWCANGCNNSQQVLGLHFLKVLRFSFPVPVVGPLLSLAFGGENIKNLPSRALALALALSLLPQKT